MFILELSAFCFANRNMGAQPHKCPEGGAAFGFCLDPKPPERSGPPLQRFGCAALTRDQEASQSPTQFKWYNCGFN